MNGQGETAMKNKENEFYQNMRKRKNFGNFRFLVYVLIGIIFGLIDYFFLDPVIRPNLILALAVWLIPIIPISIYEIKVTGLKQKTVLASITSWISAVIAYYICYAIKLSFDNLVVSFSWRDILFDILLWVVVAVVGGGIVGFSVAIIYKFMYGKY